MKTLENNQNNALSSTPISILTKTPTVSNKLIIGKLVSMLIIAVFVFANISVVALAADKWTGVDEAVVEKIAEENGRKAHDPLINTDQGDLLLFVFLLAGVAGGFMAGYYWRVLNEAKNDINGKKVKEQAV